MNLQKQKWSRTVEGGIWVHKGLGRVWESFVYLRSHMYFHVTKAACDAGRDVQRMKLERWFQTKGSFVPQRYLVVLRREGMALLASSGQRPSILLNILQCSRKPPQQR